MPASPLACDLHRNLMPPARVSRWDPPPVAMGLRRGGTLHGAGRMIVHPNYYREPSVPEQWALLLLDFVAEHWPSSVWAIRA
jgi:hypothetical protein